MGKDGPNHMSGASSQTARDINRRMLLNLIRSRQPLSRADLARISGLQRSTVSLIAEELITAGWVVEGPMGHLPRGRRPTFLQLNDGRAVICIDIRPGATTLAIGDVNGRIRSQQAFPTASDPTGAVSEIAKRIREMKRQHSGTVFEGIGVSLPGRIDPRTHHLVFAPNLQWPVVDIKTPLQRATGLEVQLENAANACALAELWFGNPGEERDFATITVSEGIGAGVVSHGELITGSSGMAGEFGHVPLEPEGPRCTCGNRGCWEVLASNRAALRYYNQARGRETIVDGRPLEFLDLLKMSEQGDVLATQALTQMAAQLGRGTRMIVAALAPEAITFIGEFTAAWSKLRPVIEAEVRAQSISHRPPKLFAGQEGASARVRGTIALVFQKHFGSPLSN